MPDYIDGGADGKQDKTRRKELIDNLNTNSETRKVLLMLTMIDSIDELIDEDNDVPAPVYVAINDPTAKNSEVNKEAEREEGDEQPYYRALVSAEDYGQSETMLHFGHPNRLFHMQSQAAPVRHCRYFKRGKKVLVYNEQCMGKEKMPSVPCK